MSHETFPFALNDIKGWIMRKKDGTVVRYNLTTMEELNKTNERTPSKQQYSGGPAFWNKQVTTGKSQHFSQWCKHQPTAGVLPIFEKDNISLYIADAPGARAVFNQFDVAIDGGNALTISGEHDLPLLYGAPELSGKLMRHVVPAAKSISSYHDHCKVLKIRWSDRCAPPVMPAFWPALLGILKSLQEKKA